jgi:hypothetical protein
MTEFSAEEITLMTEGGNKVGYSLQIRIPVLTHEVAILESSKEMVGDIQ